MSGRGAFSVFLGAGKRIAQFVYMETKEPRGKGVNDSKVGHSLFLSDKMQICRN